MIEKVGRKGDQADRADLQMAEPGRTARFQLRLLDVDKARPTSRHSACHSSSLFALSEVNDAVWLKKLNSSQHSASNPHIAKTTYLSIADLASSLLIVLSLVVVTSDLSLDTLPKSDNASTSSSSSSSPLPLPSRKRDAPSSEYSSPSPSSLGDDRPRQLEGSFEDDDGDVSNPDSDSDSGPGSKPNSSSTAAVSLICPLSSRRLAFLPLRRVFFFFAASAPATARPPASAADIPSIPATAATPAPSWRGRALLSDSEVETTSMPFASCFLPLRERELFGRVASSRRDVDPSPADPNGAAAGRYTTSYSDSELIPHLTPRPPDCGWSLLALLVRREDVSSPSTTASSCSSSALMDGGVGGSESVVRMMLGGVG